MSSASSPSSPTHGQANKAIAEAQVKTISLTNYPELLEVALEKTTLMNNPGKLTAFMANPSDESWMNG